MNSAIVGGIRIASDLRSPVSDRLILVPVVLNLDSCAAFVPEILEAQRDPRVERVLFDFRSSRKVEPEGVTLLSNLVARLQSEGKTAELIFTPSQGALSLVSFGFFEYHKEQVSNYEAVVSYQRYRPIRSRQVLKLTEVRNVQAQAFLELRYRPWLADEIGTDVDSLYTYCALVGEVFQNIAHHSDTLVGCTFSEHFTAQREVTTAISDCGITIPARVRTKFPEFDDVTCLLKACEEGFTTQTNVRNRGAGLNLLLAYVVQAYGGRVTILSGNARLVATHEPRGVKLRGRRLQWHYPGTLVLISLDIAKLQPALEADSEPEIFKW